MNNRVYRDLARSSDHLVRYEYSIGSTEVETQEPTREQNVLRTYAHYAHHEGLTDAWKLKLATTRNFFDICQEIKIKLLGKCVCTIYEERIITKIVASTKQL